MRGVGLQGLRLRRRHRTTVADPAAAKAPDLIGRDFTAPAPNRRYVGDITYLPVGERGFLYLIVTWNLNSVICSTVPPQVTGIRDPHAVGARFAAALQLATGSVVTEHYGDQEGKQ
jgi:transposase InsO family protein